MKKDSFREELEKVHLQWFGDPVDDGNDAFEDGEEEPELVLLGPDDPDPEEEAVPTPSEDDDLPPDLRGLSKKDLAAKLADMSGKADQTAALKEVMERMNQNSAKPMDIPQQQQGESDQAFRERFNKELFKSKDPAGLFQELIERTTAPYVSQLGQTIGSVTRKQLKSDPVEGEIFKKYEHEVDQMLNTLGPGDRMNPQALEWAYNRVKQNHVDDIAEARAAAKVEELVAKRVEEELAKAGVGESKPKAQPRFSESGTGAPRKRVTQRYTQEDVAAAKRRSMRLEDYLAYKRRKGA